MRDEGDHDADEHGVADDDEDSCLLGWTWLISGCQWIHLVPLDQRRRRLLNTQHCEHLVHFALCRAQHYVLCVLYTPCSTCYVPYSTLCALLCAHLVHFAGTVDTVCAPCADTIKNRTLCTDTDTLHFADTAVQCTVFGQCTNNDTFLAEIQFVAPQQGHLVPGHYLCY